jgi:hypothetical protein
MQTVPNTVGPIPAEDTLPDLLAANAASRRQLAPTMVRVVIVVGKIAAADRYGLGPADDQAGGKAADVDILQAHIVGAFDQDARTGGGK